MIFGDLSQRKSNGIENGPEVEGMDDFKAFTTGASKAQPHQRQESWNSTGTMMSRKHPLRGSTLSEKRKSNHIQYQTYNRDTFNPYSNCAIQESPPSTPTYPHAFGYIARFLNQSGMLSAPFRSTEFLPNPPPKDRKSVDILKWLGGNRLSRAMSIDVPPTAVSSSTEVSSPELPFMSATDLSSQIDPLPHQLVWSLPPSHSNSQAQSRSRSQSQSQPPSQPSDPKSRSTSSHPSSGTHSSHPALTAKAAGRAKLVNHTRSVSEGTTPTILRSGLNSHAHTSTHERTTSLPLSTTSTRRVAHFHENFSTVSNIHEKLRIVHLADIPEQPGTTTASQPSTPSTPEAKVVQRKRLSKDPPALNKKQIKKMQAKQAKTKAKEDRAKAKSEKLVQKKRKSLEKKGKKGKPNVLKKQIPIEVVRQGRNREQKRATCSCM